MIRSVFIKLVLLLLAIEAKAQDSLKSLSLQQAIEIVKRYHPVAKQADIFIEKAKADVTIAQGGFDPLLYNSHAQKNI